MNAEFDNLFDQSQTANIQPASAKISTLVKMLIKISDTYKDGWQVVKEYDLDKLASYSEHEKKLKKAKEAAGRKRKARQEDKQ